MNNLLLLLHTQM